MLKKNNSRVKDYFLEKAIARTNNQKKKTTIELKDILIPLFSAFFAVLVNQFFFENNRRIEAKIEYEKEILKNQTPVLNRILSFTYKYEVAVVYYYLTPAKKKIYYDNTGKIIKSVIEKNEEKNDTIKIIIPSFVVEENRREKLISDLNWLKSQRDFMDHEIYIAFENVCDFLDKNSLPDCNDNKQVINSVWNNRDIQEEWNKLIVELRIKCSNKIGEFK